MSKQSSSYHVPVTYIYSVEGNIGSGKSTFVRFLKENLNDPNVVFVQEPVDVWETIKDKNGETILTKFYRSNEDYAFAFQMMAYISRLSILKKTILENPGKTIITERCVETDKNVFAKMLYDSGKIKEVEYQIYLKWFDEFSSYLHVDGTIYIYTTPQKCSERVQKRNRTGESIPIEYLESCHRYHDAWLNNSNKPLLTLLNEFDVEEHEHMDKLEKFKKFINLNIKQ